jgi:hypothetical protein
MEGKKHTVQERGKTLQRLRPTIKEYSVTTAACTTFAPFSVPSLTRGDILPTARSLSICSDAMTNKISFRHKLALIQHESVQYYLITNKTSYLENPNGISLIRNLHFHHYEKAKQD